MLPYDCDSEIIGRFRAMLGAFDISRPVPPFCITALSTQVSHRGKTADFCGF